QPPLLQQRGPGIQHRHPADASCAVCRHVRLHPQGVLRSRRQPYGGRGRTDGEVLGADNACPSLSVIPGCALLGAGPESILTMVVMDSGLAASRRPGMTRDKNRMAAYGLYTHIASNKFRSMMMLAGLFVLIYVLVYAGALL